MKIHVGAYLKTTGTKAYTVNHEMNTCTNKNCTENGKDLKRAKFCSVCGSPVSVLVIPKEEKWDGSQIFYNKLDTESLAVMENSNLQRPNQECYFCTNLFDEGTEPVDRLNEIGGEYEIEEKDIEEEISWFKDFYSNEIEQLTKELGEINVTVHYGVFVYFS